MKLVIGLLMGTLILSLFIPTSIMAEKKNVQNNIHSHFNTNSGNDKENLNFGVVSNGPDKHINCSIDKNGEQKGNC